MRLPIYELRITNYDLDFSALARGDAERGRRWEEGARVGSEKKASGTMPCQVDSAPRPIVHNQRFMLNNVPLTIYGGCFFLERVCYPWQMSLAIWS